MSEKKPVSRQRRWQLKQKAEGRCICGGTPLPTNYRCARCYASEMRGTRRRKGVTNPTGSKVLGEKPTRTGLKKAR